MRAQIPWLLLCACRIGFDPIGHSGGPGDGAHDTPPGGDAALAIGCDSADTRLIACYEFEGSVADSSANANHGTAIAVSYVAGHLGMAVRSTTSTAITVQSSPTFASETFSVEMWIRIDTLPALSAREMLFDHDQYVGLWLDANGQLNCNVLGGSLVGITKFTAGPGWHHVACTADSQTVTLYVDGQPDSAGAPGTQSTGSGMVGLAGNWPPGDPFEGDVDTLRVWRVALTAQQICQAAGSC